MRCQIEYRHRRIRSHWHHRTHTGTLPFPDHVQAKQLASIPWLLRHRIAVLVDPHEPVTVRALGLGREPVTAHEAAQRQLRQGEVGHRALASAHLERVVGLCCCVAASVPGPAGLTL